MVRLALDELVGSAHTAVLTSECQGGTLGADAVFPALADAARAAGLVPRLARLLDSARAVGVHVVHGLAHNRADRLGANHNARLFGAAARGPVALLEGTAGADVVPELGPAASDIVSRRTHGLSPVSGTDVDPILRNLGVTTVVLVGVSVNVAITNAAFDLVNRGYSVVVPTDGVVGVGERYVADVIENTLALVATLTSVDDLCLAWARGRA